MNEIDLKPIRDQWVMESSDGEMGLWWLADDVREALGPGASEEDVRATTLEALKPLLRDGKLYAATLIKDADFEFWSGDIDDQLARIAEEWKCIGVPTIGDVVWFITK